MGNAHQELLQPLKPERLPQTLCNLCESYTTSANPLQLVQWRGRSGYKLEPLFSAFGSSFKGDQCRFG